MLEVIFTLAFHKNAPSVTAICHKALSLCAAKQRSRFPAKPDAVLHDAIKKNKKKLQRRGWKSSEPFEGEVWALFLSAWLTRFKLKQIIVKS